MLDATRHQLIRNAIFQIAKSMLVEENCLKYKKFTPNKNFPEYDMVYSAQGLTVGYQQSDKMRSWVIGAGENSLGEIIVRVDNSKISFGEGYSEQQVIDFLSGAAKMRGVENTIHANEPEVDLGLGEDGRDHVHVYGLQDLAHG